MYLVPSIPSSSFPSRWSRLWENWVVKQAYIVLPMGLQSPSAPPVLSAPSPGPWAQYNGWLQASTSVLISCWPDPPRIYHTSFLSASESWLQQCWVCHLQTWWIPCWGSPRKASLSIPVPFPLFFLWTGKAPGGRMGSHWHLNVFNPEMFLLPLFKDYCE